MARGWLKGFERPPWWAVIVMVVGVLGLVVGFGYATTHKPHDPVSPADAARMEAAASAAAASQSAAQARHIPTVKAATALLGQPARPWTLTVIGDSTGDGADRWVHRLAARLSADYNRPVTIHEWSIDANDYSPPTQIGAGSNAPITIWNGSASGKPASYSIQFFPKLAPHPADLVIISHGHNEPSAAAAVTEIQQLIGRVVAAQQQPPALTVTLQNPRLDSTATVQDQVVAALRQRYSGNPNVSVIDAYSAFKRAPDLAALLVSDGRHPNSAGSELWAQTAAAVLGVK